MKASGTFAIIAALAVAACSSGSQSGTPDTDAGGPVGFMGARWTANLSAQPGSPSTTVSGTGTVMGNSENTQTRVEVSLNGAQADARLPWHLHRGTCGNDQGIVGEASEYAPLTVGSDGRATGSATITVPMPTTGEYMINVHASSTDLGTIVACGNLSGPSQ
jgi:hypothetical protein